MFTTDLKFERDRQLSLHLDRYIYKALNVDKDRYVKDFPDLREQPENLSHQYDFPIIVTSIGTLPLDIQMSLIGGINLIAEQVFQWGQKPPHAPYVTWTNAGISSRNKSVVTVRRFLPSGARGAVIAEGIFQTLVHYGSVKGYTLDLPGSSVGTESVASLSLVSDEPKLFDNWPDRSFPGCGSLVCKG